MPSPKELFFQMLAKGVDVGSAGARQGLEQDHQTGESDRDRKLKELLQGQQNQFTTDTAARQRSEMEELYRRNPKSAVRVGDYSINPEAAQPLKMQLTPAQEQAEKDAGKQITNYTVSGGRPTLDKHRSALAEVQAEIAAGKRDNYDRLVGGTLNSWPTLMGLLAPTEKARRDKVRNAAGSAARATDPNPTQQQIDAIMGQVYDPSADNRTLQDKVQSFDTEIQGKAADIERAVGKYNQSGYATMGGGQAPATVDKRARLEELRRKRLGQ